MEQINQLLQQQNGQQKIQISAQQFQQKAVQNQQQKQYSQLLEELQKLVKQENVTKVEILELGQQLIKSNDFDKEGVILIIEGLNKINQKGCVEIFGFILQEKQLNLPEEVIIEILVSLLTNLEENKAQIVQNLIISKEEEIQIDPFLLNGLLELKDRVESVFQKQYETSSDIITMILAFMKLPQTKERLIKAIKNNVKMGEKIEVFLQVIYIGLKLVDFNEEIKIQPNMNNFEMWVACLVDSSYLNFCINKGLQHLLEKIDQELKNYQGVFEEVIQYKETQENYQQHQKQVQQTLAKDQGAIYYKTITL